MRIYLAGWQASTTERELRLVKAGVITHRCLSFANLVKIPGLPYYLPGAQQGYQVCLKHGVGIMMDSGVFSYRTHRAYLRRTGKDLSQLPSEEAYVELYVDWCKKYQKKWDFYVTIDIDVISAENFTRHKMLEDMGIRPMPVVHGDDSIDKYLKMYADRGYTYICLGTSRKLRNSVSQKRRYLDAAFNVGAKLGLEFHGLAATAAWMVLSFPWRSVDSSSWSRAAGYGCIMRFDPHTERMSTLHISDRASGASKLHLNGAAMSRVKKQIEAEGYDFAELQNDHTARHQYNASTMQKLAQAADAKHRTGGWKFLL